MRSVVKVALLAVIIAMLAGCDLAITKVDEPDPAFVGKKLTYTLEVTNLETTNPPEGQQTVPQTILVDRLPDSVEFVSASPSQGTCSPADSENRVLCELGTLEGEQSETVRIVVTPTEAGKIRNTAETQGCPPDFTAGIDEETGDLICGGEGIPTASEDISGQQLAESRGVIGGEPETCNGSDCDPQENNTVTITTTIKDLANPNACTITGTAANDNLRGTAGRDVICGLGGNDRIEGLGGNDTLIGGGGNDNLLGGDGSDLLRGGAGNDDLRGEDGPDRLFGEGGNDSLKGGNGQDELDGGAGKNDVRQ